jgi:3'-5' exonuclease
MARLQLMDRLVVSLDVETIPVIDDETRAYVASKIKCPETYKKPETRANWELTEKPLAVDKALEKGGLSADTGQIICIGIVHKDGEQVFCSDVESDVLHLSFQYLSTLPDQICYTGHAISNFDLPYIRQRAIVNRRRPPFSLRRAWSAKAWDVDHVFDTMTQWSSDRDKRISLDRLCRLLGIPSPKQDGMDGSKVWPLFQAGELQKIANYCVADCRAALACYQRIVEVV